MYLVVTVAVFGQTLALHPAVTALVQSSSTNTTDWTERYFLPVTCFLVSVIDGASTFHIKTVSCVMSRVWCAGAGGV